MTWQEREVQAEHLAGHDQQVRVDALRDEQLCELTRVPQDRLSDRGPPHERLERVVAQDDAGHGARRVRARLHRDPHIGLAQSAHIVGAVAHHGHIVAPLLQTAHDALLLLGRDAAENAVGLDGVGEGLVVQRIQFCARDHPAGKLEIELLDNRGDGTGVVAADDLGLHPQLGHRAEGGGHLIPQHVRDRDQRDRRELTLDPALGVGQHRRFGEDHPSQPPSRGALVRRLELLDP